LSGLIGIGRLKKIFGVGIQQRGALKARLRVARIGESMVGQPRLGLPGFKTACIRNFRERYSPIIIF
jgi:hypothetical protein